MSAKLISQSPTEVKIEFTVKLTGNMLECEQGIQEAMNQAGTMATACGLESFDTDDALQSLQKIAEELNISLKETVDNG